MDRRKTSFLINFSKVKREKQKIYIQDAEDLYEWLFQYLETEMNLREIVRAKSMFRELCGFPKDKKLTKEEELHFEHWLLFDYITVIGSRPFDLFVRSRQSEMSKYMVETAGLFMLMHLSPYRVLQSNDREHLLAPFQEERENAVRSLGPAQRLESGSLIMARIATVGFEKMMVGPCITISSQREQEALEELRTHEKMGTKSYHRFLKEMGISFLKYRAENET
ncbi:hypothetical protein [Alkalicoccus daliensis]|uniref:Uncharacterized protein n=1 Tax=Alkalicoccus daliensis TaxID=745820 RepID=A0A1H0H3U4_9BACI|nr:hypothetical protein [Alkalicoccus daliensis]SDO13829.1 hypothetical protein SAMN04488053_107170 [Alkalicoccus daliensis]